MLEMTDAARLAAARRSCLVAWAGFGKTHLIAEAIAKYPGDRRQLVLTHTHAGVASLKAKLRETGAKTGAARVDTIAGWCLQYASCFPETSGLKEFLPENEGAWSHVYRAMAKLLQYRWLKDIVSTSYSGVYVDEYQDCTIEQHAVITGLAEFLPCRVLGDPMQGIFGFHGTMIDWDRDVSRSFETLPGLTTPWRWAKSNAALGAWLIAARKNLVRNGSLDFKDPAVRWRCLPSSKGEAAQAKTRICMEAMAWSGSVVAIAQWEKQCQSTASKLSGVYSCVEKVDFDDLYDHAERISAADGVARSSAVLSFARSCMTGLPAAAAWIAGTLGSDRPVKPGVKYYRQYEALQKVVMSGSDALGSSVIGALDTLDQTPGIHIYRRELLNEMRHSLCEYCTGRYSNLREAAWHARNATREAARQPRGKLLGRTLLVKGLEFDHAVVLDADVMDVKNLYVAITRGSRSLTVLSRQPTVVVKTGA